MKLQEPKLEFYQDENDAKDCGGWRIEWGEIIIYLSSEYSTPDELHVMIDLPNGGDSQSAVFYPGGKIELGAYGANTSFDDLHRCLDIRRAVRLLNNVK